MVNNSTNINKMNNHLSPKESLNSNGQQFYQYKQNEQSLLTSNIWTEKGPWRMMLEIHVLALDKHKHAAGLKLLMGS